MPHMMDGTEADWVELARKVLRSPGTERFDPSLMLRICVSLAEKVEALEKQLAFLQGHAHWIGNTSFTSPPTRNPTNRPVTRA